MKPTPPFSDELLEKFWSRVNKEFQCWCHTPENNCWVWTGATNAYNKGVFVFPKDTEGKKPVMMASHMMYLFTHERIPKGTHIINTSDCRITSCVRHIEAGHQKMASISHHWFKHI